MTNWDDMEVLWDYCFTNELRVNPNDHPCLFTEGTKLSNLAQRNPKINRERTMEIMFNTFGVPSFYLANEAVLSLLASGQTTGLVLDSGHDITHAVPVSDGSVLSHAIESNGLGGRDLTQYMAKLLHEIGEKLDTPADTEVVKDIKEKLCYVAHDYNQAMGCIDMCYLSP